MNTERFKNAIWFDEIGKTTCIIGGAGSIGSWLALSLSRLNMKRIKLSDFDEIEEVNLAGQFYSYLDVGLNKVDAIKKNIMLFSEYNMKVCLCNISYEDITDEKLIFSAFDNIEARRILFNKFIEKEVENSIFIDGRLEAESYIIYTVKIDDKEQIENYLKVLDEKIDDTVCSYKYTTYMAMMIAAKMTNFAINHITNIVKPKSRYLPFREQFYSPLNRIL